MTNYPVVRHLSCRFPLFCFDGADLEFAATKKFRVFTVAVGTDTAMLDRTIGLPAGVANGNSGHGAHFKLRALRELVLVRRRLSISKIPVMPDTSPRSTVTF